MRRLLTLSSGSLALVAITLLAPTSSVDAGMRMRAEAESPTETTFVSAPADEPITAPSTTEPDVRTPTTRFETGFDPGMVLSGEPVITSIGDLDIPADRG